LSAASEVLHEKMKRLGLLRREAEAAYAEAQAN